MNNPKASPGPGREREQCQLNKCIYGLKQASRVWNKHFEKFLRSFGLVASKSDPCVYYHYNDGRHTVVAIWVDDGLVCSNDGETTTKILEYHNKHFEVRSGPVDNFVGLKITRKLDRKYIHLSQPEYTEKIIRKFNIDKCQPKSLQADLNARLTSRKENDRNGKHNTAGTFPC